MPVEIITPQAVTLGLFMMGLVTFVALLVGILSIIKFFRPHPALHQQYASKTEVEKLDKKLIQTETKLETQIENLSNRITEQYEKIERSDEARTSGLHNRMNGLAENVAKMTGALESNKQMMDAVVKALVNSTKTEVKA